MIEWHDLEISLLDRVNDVVSSKHCDGANGGKAPALAVPTDKVRSR
jgi:hypothetical protein